MGSNRYTIQNFTPTSEGNYKNLSEERKLPDRYPNPEILRYKARILY
jgi:hypothetical protein